MRLRFLLICTGACLFALSTSASAAGAFRWRDAHGQVHYSSLLPPEAVDQGYEVLDRNGEVVQRVPAPLTPAQRAQAEAEAKRIEKQAAARAEQARRDHMLLRTFGSVSDIVRLRDDRVSALDVQIRLVREHLQRLQARRAELAASRDKLVGGKRPVPADLTRAIENLRLEQADTSQTLRSLEAERNSTQRSFARDITRFKELEAMGRVPQ